MFIKSRRATQLPIMADPFRIPFPSSLDVRLRPTPTPTTSRRPSSSFVDKPFAIKDPRFNVIGGVYVDICRFKQYCNNLVDKTGRYPTLSMANRICESDIVFGLLCILSNLMTFIFSRDFKYIKKNTMFDLELLYEYYPLSISLRKIFLDTIECLNIAIFYGFNVEYDPDSEWIIMMMIRLNYINDNRVIQFVRNHLTRIVSVTTNYTAIRSMVLSIFQLHAYLGPAPFFKTLSLVHHSIRRTNTVYFDCLIQHALKFHIGVRDFKYLLKTGLNYGFHINNRIVKNIGNLSRTTILYKDTRTHGYLLDIIKLCIQAPKNVDDEMVIIGHTIDLWGSIAKYIKVVYNAPPQIAFENFPIYLRNLLRLYSRGVLDEFGLVTHVADKVTFYIDKYYTQKKTSYVYLTRKAITQYDSDLLYETALSKPEIYPLVRYNDITINDLFERNTDIEVLANNNPVTPSSPAITYELIRHFVNKISSIPIYLPFGWNYDNQFHFRILTPDRLIRYGHWYGAKKHFTKYGCNIKLRVICRNDTFIIGLPREIIELVREFF